MITYCTNIHPGETWSEILANIKSFVPAVRNAVSPDDTFPVGLRLSDLASHQIDDDASRRFMDWCSEIGCCVPTINGFPFGAFHSERVKEEVYAPDWRHKERVDYTIRLAGLLDAWLPTGVTGSISTVPVGFKGRVRENDLSMVRRNLTTVLEYMDRLKQKSGKKIILSLEPEPGCVLETTDEVIRFFEQITFPESIRESIGVCFDCCHQAVEYENPRESVDALLSAGIPIGKVQVSSALSIRKAGTKNLSKLNEPRYLHQVIIRRRDGGLVRFNDIPEALDFRENDIEEWRIHFHVPLFLETMGTFGTTGYFAGEVLDLVDGTTLFEVETYTWNVLPREYKSEDVTRSIIREINWVKSRIYEKNHCH